jgi:hypothetical protein
LPDDDEEVSVTLPPEQKVVALPAEIVGVATELTVTVVADEAADEQPLVVTTTV